MFVESITSLCAGRNPALLRLKYWEVAELKEAERWQKIPLGAGRLMGQWKMTQANRRSLSSVQFLSLTWRTRQQKTQWLLRNGRPNGTRRRQSSLVKTEVFILDPRSWGTKRDRWHSKHFQQQRRLIPYISSFLLQPSSPSVAADHRTIVCFCVFRVSCKSSLEFLSWLITKKG